MVVESGFARQVARVLTLFCLVSLGGLGGGTAAWADTWRDRQWHLDFLKADAVHRLTKGAGVTVAVVDTGVNADHSDLKGNVLKGKDLIDEGGDGRKDNQGHGTAMASLIAGHGHGPGHADGALGLAPEAKIFPVRLLPDDEYPRWRDDGGATEKAFQAARLSDAKVVNFSGITLGIEEDVKWTLWHDIVFVAAAGNRPRYAKVQEPASYPGVVAVSGVDRNGRFDPKVSVKGPEVVLAAPAVDLAGAWAGKRGPYALGTGTSGATALVSATAALIRAKYPKLSANGVINRLIKTADDKGPPGRDPMYGFGVVNPLKALTADIPDIDYNPLIGRVKPSLSHSAVADPSPTISIDPDDIDYGGGMPSWTLPAIVGLAAGLATAAGFAIARRRRRAKLRELEDRLADAITMVTSAYPPTGPPPGPFPAGPFPGGPSGPPPVSPGSPPFSQAPPTPPGSSQTGPPAPPGSPFAPPPL